MHFMLTSFLFIFFLFCRVHLEVLSIFHKVHPEVLSIFHRVHLEGLSIFHRVHLEVLPIIHRVHLIFFCTNQPFLKSASTFFPLWQQRYIWISYLFFLWQFIKYVASLFSVLIFLDHLVYETIAYKPTFWSSCAYKPTFYCPCSQLFFRGRGLNSINLYFIIKFLGKIVSAFFFFILRYITSMVATVLEILEKCPRDISSRTFRGHFSRTSRTFSRTYSRTLGKRIF